MTAERVKAAYVSAAGWLRRRLKGGRLFQALEKRRHNRWALWFRSLFAIYDFEETTQLDLPWWSFGAKDEVERFLQGRPGARVFEYGSGASTIWLASRAGQVISVEHDADFVDLVSARITGLKNVKLLCVTADPMTQTNSTNVRSNRVGWTDFDFHRYVDSLNQQSGLFDMIIIDGRARSHCLPVAVNKLKAGGLIVFDNSRRVEYSQAIENSGLVVKRIGGLTVALPYPDETALITVPQDGQNQVLNR